MPPGNALDRLDTEALPWRRGSRYSTKLKIVLVGDGDEAVAAEAAQGDPLIVDRTDFKGLRLANVLCICGDLTSSHRQHLPTRHTKGNLRAVDLDEPEFLPSID